jgi:hypothetical protein
MKETRLGLKKLVDRSRPMVMIDYEHGSKAYRLYDPLKKRLQVSRDVIFRREHQLGLGEHDGGVSMLIVENWTMPMPASSVTGASSSPENRMLEWRLRKRSSCC